MTDKFTRKSHVKRFWNYGSGNDDYDYWVDVEQIDRLVFERGKGRAYQKTEYNFNWDDNSKHITEDKRVVFVGDDPARAVKVPAVHKLKIAAGKGRWYQATVLTFDNSAGNNKRLAETPPKKVKSHHINASFLTGDQPPRDPDAYIEALKVSDASPDDTDGGVAGSNVLQVEVPLKFTNVWGRGRYWQEKVVKLDKAGDVLMVDPIIPES